MNNITNSDINAVKWEGQNSREMFDFLTDSVDKPITLEEDTFRIEFNKYTDCRPGDLIIKTLDGEVQACIGDYVVKAFDSFRVISKNIKKVEINMTKTAQIAFAGNSNLEVVEKQLIQLAESLPDCKFKCCFLNRQMVMAKGFNTDIVDLLDRVIGNRLEYAADKYNTFEEFMQNIDEAREEVSCTTDELFILDCSVVKGISKEMELRGVICM